MCHVRVAGDAPAGELVISNLVDRATVLLNYPIGDFGVMSDRPCSCGRTLPLLEDLVGRVEEITYLPSGRWIIPSEFRHLFRVKQEILDFQVIQREPASFTIRIVPAPGAALPELERGLRAELARLVGDDASLAIEWTDRIPSMANGKVTRICALPTA
jgi:phenylacetate-CoA ligase